MVWHVNKIAWFFVVSLSSTFFAFQSYSAEIGKAGVYSIVELTFHGPVQNHTDVPARDIDFWVRFHHESGSPEYKIHGFWDGNGKGGISGNVFKVCFCPTKTGRWNLVQICQTGQAAGLHLSLTLHRHKPAAHRHFVHRFYR